MSPEAQRIAIAEACGWVMEPKDKWLHKGNPNETHPTGRWMGQLPTEIPEIDLNAMHEAEKCNEIKARGVFAYAGSLSSIVFRDFGFPIESTSPEEQSRACIFATAAQRAEAFLRTIGKWTEHKGEQV